MSEYEFIQISESLIDDFLDLQAIVTGNRANRETIQNRFDTGVFGASYVGYLAYDSSGSPAAYYGVFPITLSVSGQHVLGAQSGSTMTHPDHQKRGLFVAAAQKTYELAQEQGVKIVFGFPNRNSFPGFSKKLGWSFVDDFYDFVIPTNRLPIGALANRIIGRNPFLKHIERHSVASKLVRAADMLMSDGVLKDENFLTYKLQDKSCHLLEIDGFVLLAKITAGTFRLGEVGHFDIERLPDFIAALEHLARKSFCHRIQVTVSSQHWLFDYLSMHNKPSVSLPIGGLVLGDDLDMKRMSFCWADADTF